MKKTKIKSDIGRVCDICKNTISRGEDCIYQEWIYDGHHRHAHICIDEAECRVRWEMRLEMKY
jgi:hypothetical protein